MIELKEKKYIHTKTLKEFTEINNFLGNIGYLKIPDPKSRYLEYRESTIIIIYPIREETQVYYDSLSPSKISSRFFITAKKFLADHENIKATVKTTKIKTTTRKIELTLKKNSSETYIHLKIPKELEELYKKLSDKKTSQSKYWLLKDGSGANFYVLNQEYKAIEKEILDGILFFNNYGDGLLKRDSFDSRINTALLRTVGVGQEGGVEIISQKFEAMTGFDLEHYIRNLAKCSKQIWEYYISKQSISGTITFNL